MVHTSTRLTLALLLATLPALSGCSGFIYSQTGSTLSGYAKTHMVPWLMSREDVGLACSTGSAVGPLIGSFERVVDTPDLAMLVSWVGAGMCAEASAWEAELASLRAVKAGNASASKDARMVEERYHRVAAMRFHVAWQRAQHHFVGKGDDPKAKLGGKTCPEVEPEEEVYLLLGAASGLLAVLHDRASGGAANVDTSILPAAARTAKCLDAKRWWGVPLALQAAVWMTVPGSEPKGTDKVKSLADAAAMGDAAGVRLARALQVMALEGAGDMKGMAKAVAAHQASIEAKKAPARWRLLDAYGRRMTQQSVDRVWSKEKGFRGPTGELTLPEKEPEAGAGDDMLDGLDG